MTIDFTPIARLIFRNRTAKIDSWRGNEADVQRGVLHSLLAKARDTEFGRTHSFGDILASGDNRANADLQEAFAEAVVPEGYEAYRPLVMRMIEGEENILWPGRCYNFAQSSGTSGGRSKFIPVTPDGLRQNHYAGAADVVAMYLKSNPESRMFTGKGFILGGSFASELKASDPKVRIGDLSASLIDNINPLAGFFRIPSKKTALLPDWSVKLEALAREAMDCNVTNLSGVPSWFMRVLLHVAELKGVENVRKVWPGLEVFFHGGISFEPYRNEYASFCGPEAGTVDSFGNPVGNEGMHYFETYNASEGFFAVQSEAGPGRKPLQLLLDRGVYYEFLPLGSDTPVGVADVVAGKVYELMITSCNGLWRYRLGDTVRIESVSPLTITLAGRTKTFINAFGEELMESNAEQAIARACRECGATVANYTAGPVFATEERRGRHQWLIEWRRKPESIEKFTESLDSALCDLNSDYAAKRSHTIFLDPPLVTSLPAGAFDRWLHHAGNGKLGGQRKVPRLSNDRRILDSILSEEHI